MPSSIDAVSRPQTAIGVTGSPAAALGYHERVEAVGLRPPGLLDHPLDGARSRRSTRCACRTSCRSAPVGHNLPTTIKGRVNGRRFHHRRLPHAARDRQAGEGRARAPAPAARRGDRARARSSTGTASTPPTSTTSSGARARRCASRAATSVAWPRSTPATTCARAASPSTASAARASRPTTSPRRW